jgi:hypothetical protein
LNVHKINLWNKLSINTTDPSPNIFPPNNPQSRYRAGNIAPLQTPDDNGVEAKKSYDFEDLAEDVTFELKRYLRMRGEPIVIQE